jgi:CDGSH-type Zn-finger protein/ferredoxin
MMKKSQIIFSKYSPLMAVDSQLVDSDDHKMEIPRVCSLCRCGESNAKPLCDGTHAQVGFLGEREDSNKQALEYYRGKEITIVYDRYLCMGAGYCGELEAVFGTHDAPKYEPDAAPVEDIIATIRKCPSGALSYIIGDEHYKNYFDETLVAVQKDGPYHCWGDIAVIDDQESDLLLPDGDHFTLCRCGGSKKKPLCDGSHEEKGFKG